MRLRATAVDQHDLGEPQHDDEKDDREQRRGRNEAGAAGLDDLIGALVGDHRCTGRRRLEMARPAGIVVEALGGLHQRPSAIASIRRSSERGCWAGFPLADCSRVSGLAGVAFAGTAGSGAASAVAINWIFGIPEGGVAAPTVAAAPTTISADADGAAATGVAVATDVAGGATG